MEDGIVAEWPEDAKETVRRLRAELLARAAADTDGPDVVRISNDAYDSMCLRINTVLDGKDDGRGVASEPWESTRRRLLAVRAELAAGRQLCLAVVRGLASECNLNDPDEVFGFSRLTRTESQIRGDETL